MREKKNNNTPFVVLQIVTLLTLLFTLSFAASSSDASQTLSINTRRRHCDAIHLPQCDCLRPCLFSTRRKFEICHRCLSIGNECCDAVCVCVCSKRTRYKLVSFECNAKICARMQKSKQIQKRKQGNGSKKRTRKQARRRSNP